MRTLTLLLAAALLAGCQKKNTTTASKAAPIAEEAPERKPLIRSLIYSATDETYMVTVNGDKGDFQLDKWKVKERINEEIPFATASGLIEDFYAIRGIEDYRGKHSDNRQTAIHHLIMIYDERPDRYSEDTVDYVIPKKGVEPESPLGQWLERLWTLRDEVKAKHAGQAEGDGGKK